jgi:hypothetical protein
MLRIVIANLKDMRRRHAERKALDGTCKFLYMPKCIQEGTIEYNEDKVPTNTLWQTDCNMLEGRAEMVSF